MKTRILFIASILLLLVVLTACTQQKRAKSFGGTADIELPAGAKLVTATWKEEQLWYLTRPMRADEQPEVFTLTESSSFGIIQGRVRFTEKK